jgi:hypothetical protein
MVKPGASKASHEPAPDSITAILDDEGLVRLLEKQGIDTVPVLVEYWVSGKVDSIERIGEAQDIVVVQPGLIDRRDRRRGFLHREVAAVRLAGGGDGDFGISFGGHHRHRGGRQQNKQQAAHRFQTPLQRARRREVAPFLIQNIIMGASR